MTDEELKEYIDNSIYNCGVAIIQSLSDFTIRHTNNLFAKRENYQRHIDSPLKRYDEILSALSNRHIKNLSIPCMPNGKVFYIKDGEIIEDEFSVLFISCDGSQLYTTKNDIVLLAINFGKTWFLTKEEADTQTKQLNEE